MLNELMLLSDSIAGDSLSLQLALNLLSGSATNNPQEIIIKEAYHSIVTYFQSCFEKEQIQLSASEISGLELLAMECPFVYGQGVFAARALLMAHDNQKRLFVNACELPQQTNAGNRMGGEVDGFVWSNFSDWGMEEESININSEKESQESHGNKLSNTRVFPNPFSHQLSIETNDMENGQWFLMDLAGRILLQGITKGTLTSIDVSTLSFGSYLLQVVHSTGKKEQFQIIK
jgi:hypothetical protein